MEEHAHLADQMAMAESSCSEAQHQLQQLEETLQQVHFQALMLSSLLFVHILLVICMVHWQRLAGSASAQGDTQQLVTTLHCHQIDFRLPDWAAQEGAIRLSLHAQALLVNEQRSLTSQEQAAHIARLEKRCSKHERTMASLRTDKDELAQRTSTLATLTSEHATLQSQVRPRHAGVCCALLSSAGMEAFDQLQAHPYPLHVLHHRPSARSTFVQC